MTVKELQEFIKDAPQWFEVRYEYNGPDAHNEIPVKYVIVSESAHCVLLTDTED